MSHVREKNVVWHTSSINGEFGKYKNWKASIWKNNQIAGCSSIMLVTLYFSRHADFVFTWVDSEKLVQGIRSIQYELSEDWVNLMNWDCLCLHSPHT